MKKHLFLLLFLFNGALVQAHQADVSATVLSQQKGKWILQIKSALTAFKYAVAENFPEKNYESVDEFKTLLTELVLNNLSLTFDEDKQAELINPIVQIGHETNVIFEVKGVPEKFRYLQIRNTCFSRIKKSQSALVIYREGFAERQFVLNEANAYITDLVFEEGEVRQPDGEKESSLPNLLLLAGVPFLLLGTYGLVRRKS